MRTFKIYSCSNILKYNIVLLTVITYIHYIVHYIPRIYLTTECLYPVTTLTHVLRPPCPLLATNMIWFYKFVCCLRFHTYVSSCSTRLLRLIYVTQHNALKFPPWHPNQQDFLFFKAQYYIVCVIYSEHLCLVPDLREKAFKLSQLKV